MELGESNVDDEWEQFMSFNTDETINCNNSELAVSSILDQECPKASDIYISTKTNISYLNKDIDLKKVFWMVPIIKYSLPQVGVVKKQMKFNSIQKEELNEIQEQLKSESCVEENVMTSIDNPTGRIKFKDIRKVSIGICKKDVLSYRSKKKSAFYNCFVLILRIMDNSEFKEFHVKVFNTGKLEIPGIQTDEVFDKVIKMVVDVLTPYVDGGVEVLPDKTQTVLINSNFNCGFYINREVLFETLRSKYNIESIYDPCSYPGIQCKFYYQEGKSEQTGVRTGDDNIDVSFMVFRTGSVLIVGKCQESVLLIIYDFLKKVLYNEFSNVGVHIIEDNTSKAKYKKIRKKTIVIS